MTTIKYRKRVPSVLVPMLNRREFNITFKSQAEVNKFKTLLDECVVIANSGLPLEITTPIVLDKGLEQYHIQLKSTHPNPMYLMDIVALYLAYSKTGVTPNEQRRRVLFFNTLPSMFDTLHIPTEITKITPKHLYVLSEHLGALVSPTTKLKRKPQTINREIKMIRGMVNYGIQTGLYSLPSTMPTLKLSSSPIERTSLPKGTLTLIEPLLSSKAFLLLQVVYYSGMRNSEVSKYTITNVDGVVCFDLTSTELKLKTKQSARLIPIHSKLLPYIEETFTATSVQTLARSINKALRTLYDNGQAYTLYSARHSIVTNLINKSVRVEKVQAIVGHSSNASMTIGVYHGGFELSELKECIELL